MDVFHQNFRLSIRVARSTLHFSDRRTARSSLLEIRDSGELSFFHNFGSDIHMNTMIRRKGTQYSNCTHSNSNLTNVLLLKMLIVSYNE